MDKARSALCSSVGSTFQACPSVSGFGCWLERDSGPLYKVTDTKYLLNVRIREQVNEDPFVLAYKGVISLSVAHASTGRGKGALRSGIQKCG